MQYNILQIGQWKMKKTTCLSTLASLILASVAEESVTGDLETWDMIFASRTYHVLVHAQANDLVWTEGPVLIKDDGGDDKMLIFSETISSKTYSVVLDEHKHLRVIKERSGDAPRKDDSWRAEPGGNGLALLSYMPPILVVCQHGAQRLSIMDLITGETKPIASQFGGKRFNGPNDVVIRSEMDGNQEHLFAYFTDPVYAWLEKDRFEDLPYLDERVQTHGPGHCGVYRVKLLTKDVHSQANIESKVELIVSDMMRPNGIGFRGNDLIVSDCCQGFHLDDCRSGTSRWRVFGQQEQGMVKDNITNLSSWIHNNTIEDVVPADAAAEGGCADGFDVYEYVNKKGVHGHVLLASCFGGLCIVDLEAGVVVSRMWTAREHGGCRISNIAVGKEFAFLTGSCGILTLPLVSKNMTDRKPAADQTSQHSEL
jgi:sugar lactone lactonase YvrE